MGQSKKAAEPERVRCIVDGFVDVKGTEYRLRPDAIFEKDHPAVKACPRYFVRFDATGEEIHDAQVALQDWRPADNPPPAPAGPNGLALDRIY